MIKNKAWYLRPRPNLSKESMIAAAQAHPGKFIELMLKKELIEAAAFDAEQTFVAGGFGPGVYLGSMHQADKKIQKLVEVEFNINKYSILICNVKSQVFVKRNKADAGESSSATLPIDVGEGYMIGATRLVPREFHKLDARQYPMLGISLNINKIRQTRFYYLNVLLEFTQALFNKAGISFERSTFVATHCVDDGYIPLEPLAQLSKPLVVVNASSEPMDKDTLKPLIHAFFPHEYHVVRNKKIQFEQPVVSMATAIPDKLNTETNYLFLNGKAENSEQGTVRIAKKETPSEFQLVKANEAYEDLLQEDSIVDPYTEFKFNYLINRDSILAITQGLNLSPSDLVALPLGKTQKAEQKKNQEAIKRCLVELSLKECLLGHKVIPVPKIPIELISTELSLIATRQIRVPHCTRPKQLVAVVEVCITKEGIVVKHVRRSPWSQDASAAIDFVSEFPFLQPEGKRFIQDDQFWIVDKQTQSRLTVWSGQFVPRIILNDSYTGIEAALAAQEPYIESRREDGKIKGKLYSKNKRFNLLPYYMSIFKPEYQNAHELTGSRIPVQDCGGFLRVFVPPAGGIKGNGSSLSGMRDVMLYTKDGNCVSSGLLEQKLVLLYLHTMTNGILVGGDNSKMTILEKMARLALEN
ncbi:hypothetical protein FE394_07060 [Xenorhabdus sp. Reich]|uniref:Uncharacterized protein n=1 Tax=Xenorhabdus littoralis TaxID=2582835 RepID=A0ABU4SK33_9GAMM|nr:hypothetical protein [Xenorhabdus sp. Reich]